MVIVSSVAYSTLPQLFSDDTDAYNGFIEKVKSNLSAYASLVASRNNNTTSAADLLTFFTSQYDLLVNDQVPAAELIFYTCGQTLQTVLDLAALLTRQHPHHHSQCRCSERYAVLFF